MQKKYLNFDCKNLQMTLIGFNKYLPITRPSSMPINIDKPRNKSMKAIRITEFKDHIINPDPIILQETDVLLEEFLSPTKLVSTSNSLVFSFILM
jgi:hypothetical protein